MPNKLFPYFLIWHLALWRLIIVVTITYGYFSAEAGYLVIRMGYWNNIVPCNGRIGIGRLNHINSSKKLIYNNIQYRILFAPQMPTLNNGTKCLKFLLSKTSNDVQKPLFLCISLLLGTYQLSKKSAPRPHLDGTLWHNGYHCCRKQR